LCSVPFYLVKEEVHMQKIVRKSTILLLFAAIGLGSSSSWAGESKQGESRSEGVRRDNISLRQLESISRHYESPGKKAGIERLLPKVPSFGCR